MNARIPPETLQPATDATAMGGQVPSLGEANGGIAACPGDPLAVLEACENQPPVVPQNIAGPSRLRRMLVAPIKFFWGMFLCQSVLGALAVIGWTYRSMQRSVLKHWWNSSQARAKGDSFAEFAAGDTRARDHVHWPNWFLAQNFREAVLGNRSLASDSKHPPGEGSRTTDDTAQFPSREGTGAGSGAEPAAPHAVQKRKLARPGRLLQALGQSLWLNVRLGVQGIFNTWVLTLPAFVLMLFGWYDGWNNSFNKGYEQFLVGPGISWLGIMLFIAAMLYVPMAQARQAVSGNWRSFYQFRLIWTLVRRRWLACFGLAALYAIGSIPILILSSVLVFLPNINPKLAGLAPGETIKVLNAYFFWSALFVFPAFVLLRLLAARIYGTALLKAVQIGAVAQDALAESEWQALHRLELLQVQPPRLRHPVLRIAVWAGTRAGRVTFGLLTGLVWFAFIVELYVGQFFNYRGAPVWLNQPLVHLPWFHHLPAALKNPWGDFFAAAAVVFVAWRLRRLVNWLKSLRRSRRGDPLLGTP